MQPSHHGAGASPAQRGEGLLREPPGRLVAVGRVLKSGRTLTVCQLEVFAEQAGKRVPVAVGQQTLMCLNEPGTRISA